MLACHRNDCVPKAVGPLAPRPAWLRRRHGRPALPVLRKRPCVRVPALEVRSQYVPASQPAPRALARRPALAADDFVLPRSTLMGREVITRTTGKRLGYIDQMYVDPSQLQVVSLYLRRDALLPFSSVGATTTDHFHVRNLLQIGDVVLVHDEQVLMEPPADQSNGFYRLVGSTVKTEAGVELGKVRDFLFNPDDGRISTIKYDRLGIAALPQVLLTTYCLSYMEVVAVGPAEIIVRSGAELRAIKENDGLLSQQIISSMASTLSSWSLSGGGSGGGDGEEVVRDDLEYARWWVANGEAHEAYYGTKITRPSEAALAAVRREMQRASQPLPPPAQQQPQGQPPPARSPRALPPPSAQTFGQALQPAQEGWQVAPAREAVPAGAGWGTAGAPPQPPRMQQQQPAAGWQGQGGLAEVQFPAQPAAPRQPLPQPPLNRAAVGPAAPAPARGPPLPPYPQPAAPAQEWAQPAPGAGPPQPWGQRQPAPLQPGMQGQQAPPPPRGMQGLPQGPPPPQQQQQLYPAAQPGAQQFGQGQAAGSQRGPSQ